FLAERKGGLVVVSHDRELLDRTVTRIVEIEPGSRRVREFAGSFSEYEVARDRARSEAYARFDEAEERRNRVAGLLARRRGAGRGGRGGEARGRTAAGRTRCRRRCARRGARWSAPTVPRSRSSRGSSGCGWKRESVRGISSRRWKEPSACAAPSRSGPSTLPSLPGSAS